LEYLERGIDMLNAVHVPGVKEHIVTKTIATPEDFEKRLSLPWGNIYGFSMSMLSQMAFRPGNRSRCVHGLYLCGGSTHTCSVPGAVNSGVMAADLACEDLERRRAA
jgi:phytoene dehydrogenase-like protein